MILVNIGSYNGLVPDGTKPLPAPKQTSLGRFCSIHMRTIYKHMSKLLKFMSQHIEAIQNGRNFAHDIFKRIFLNENIWIVNISPIFIPKGPIGNISALIQIMAWCRTGDKPLSEPMVA